MARSKPRAKPPVRMAAPISLQRRATSCPVGPSPKQSSVLGSTLRSRARGESRAMSGQVAPFSHLLTAGAVTPR